MRGLIILLSCVGVVLLIVLMGKLFNLSPLDVATGRVKTHLREDIFGDNILLYVFNFGASGSLIEKNPVIAFLAYCYIIIFIKDVMQKRLDPSRKKELVMMVFLAWAVLGGIATIFFQYAPPRFFLFLYPPIFLLAAAALSRFLDPAPRGVLGYGFYVVFPLWLIFLVFRLLLLILSYGAENLDTFVIGLGLSLDTARNILGFLAFAGSFYFLLSISLILSIIISAVAFLIERRALETKRDLFIRKGIRIAVVGVVVLVFLIDQGGMFLRWFEKPRYTMAETSRELGDLLGSGAKIAGPYAHPLTMENDLSRVYMTFWDPNRQPPCDRFEKSGVTHLVIDTTNGLGYIHANYPEAMNCLSLIETFYVRGNPVNLYLYTGARGYVPTDFERAKLLMDSENFPEAAELLSRFIDKHPDVPAAYVSLAHCYVKLGDREASEKALRAALSRDPDNMMAHWGLGQILDAQGNPEEALVHYREAHDLYPTSTYIEQRLRELQSREK